MNMKRLLASAAALAALAIAAPAGAQDYAANRHFEGPPGYSYSYSYAQQSARQLERLQFRMREGAQSGALNRWEARRLFGQLRETQFLRTQYLNTRGFNRWEMRDLDTRIQNLRFELRQALFDGDGRRAGAFDRDFDGYRGERGYGHDDHRGQNRHDDRGYDLR